MHTQNLHYQVKTGNLGAVLELLTSPGSGEGRDVNGYDSAGHTPLMLAVAGEAADVEIIRALIDHGADTNLLSKNPGEQDISVVGLALGVGDPAIVGLLLEHGADILYRRDEGYDALIDAVHGRDLLSDKRLIDLLKLLIDHHVELNTVTSYHESGTRVLSRIGRFDALKCLLEAGADEGLIRLSPLMRAVVFGTAADVQREMEGNPPLEEIDYWERTAWLFAVQVGDIVKAELLQKAGANTDACGRCGMPSLFYAIQNHQLPMLRWLIDTGVPVNVTDDFGTTCLMTAAEYENIEAIDELVRAGADVNEKTSYRFDYSQPPEIASILKDFDASMFEEAPSMRTVLGNAHKADVARRLLEAGADPQDLEYEARRGLLGLVPEPDETLLDVTPNEFKAGRSPRFGSTNPELLQEPFCESMVRSGLNAYGARAKYGGDEYKNSSPVWCASRFGQSITFLPNGDIVQIAGEHEDHYDPDFYIYNDVFVHRPDGTIRIYIYPKSAFPPTDFHTATLVGNDIIIIGNLGYPAARRYGATPVYRLDTETFKISQILARGAAPGWIYGHRAVLQSPQQILVSGGSILTHTKGQETHVANDQVYLFDVKLFRWSIAASGG